MATPPDLDTRTPGITVLTVMPAAKFSASLAKMKPLAPAVSRLPYPVTEPHLRVTSLSVHSTKAM
ncbi:MAG: hypothetical protein QOG22_1095, partial [Pseudonocardiales bacterium]|nr:hypothetical protein [Pseudonocardiales bacterium]